MPQKLNLSLPITCQLYNARSEDSLWGLGRRGVTDSILVAYVVHVKVEFSAPLKMAGINVYSV